MHNLTIVIGEETHQAQAESGRVIGEVLAELELPVEQPCAGRAVAANAKSCMNTGWPNRTISNTNI